jgi:molybdopterin-guanine dinucleotide biosynthesis protein A
MPQRSGTANFAAILMAGGASTRMGQPKALIDYQGLPLWRFQANKLLSLQPSELLISAPMHLQFEEGPWKIIHDRQADLGPLAGLDAALNVVSTDYLVVLAVDMPAITIPFLQRLAGYVDGKGIVPELDGFYHGLVAVYPTKIHPIVRQILLSDDRSLQHLVKKARTDDLVEIYLVKDCERPLFQNLNSPSDF